MTPKQAVRLTQNVTLGAGWALAAYGLNANVSIIIGAFLIGAMAGAIWGPRPEKY